MLEEWAAVNGTRLIPAGMGRSKWDEAHSYGPDSESHFPAGEIFILKTKLFREVTTVLSEIKHLKIVFRSVPDSVFLLLDRLNRPGLFRIA